MRLADVLHSKGHDVVTADIADTLGAIVGVLAQRRIGAVVVLDRFRPVGVFSERDLVNVLAAHGTDALQIAVAQVMSGPIVSGLPEDRIEDALSVMTRERIRHLPIIEEGKLVGLVSIGDLVKQRLNEKELEANVLQDLARMRA